MHNDSDLLIVFFIAIVGIVLVVMVPITILGRMAACRSAEVFNKQNGTTWTCSDFFWASDQINSGRQKIEILNK